MVKKYRISGPADINILCDIQTGMPPNQFFSFNQVVAWYLQKAFRALGLTVNLVDVHLPDHPEKGLVPTATHTLNISCWATSRLRNDMNYYVKILQATENKLCMYLDSDLGGYDQIYDKIFCVIEPLSKSSDSYVYAGWGADPDTFYPDSDGKTIFVDSYVGEMFNKQYVHVESLYREAFPLLEQMGWTIYQPIEYYQDKRILYGEYQKCIRRGSVFFLTQVGESGLSKIEALYCGQELVVHKDTHRPRTEGRYAHSVHVWSSVSELVEIMEAYSPDIEKIRANAMKDNWSEVVNRIMRELKI